jgi:CBS domain-containing protein
MEQRLVDFLADVPPFHLLSVKKQAECVSALRKSHHLKDMVLFVQNKTMLNYIYIVLEGRLEQYILEDNEKSLKGFLGQKDLYGGLSILFNKGLSIRTVRTLEDTTFYRLPKEMFLDLCSENEDFTKFFTENFSQKMMKKTYIDFIAKSVRLSEDQAAPGFMNQTLANIFSREVISCSENDSVQEAARLMTGHKRSALVVCNAQADTVGLITDHDLREKIITPGLSLETKVGTIASSPLITLSSGSNLFEALLLMMEYNIKHLAVTDETSEVMGIATEQDLMLAQGQSPVFLIHEIQEATTIKELAARYRQLPGIIKNLIEGGARPQDVNHIITAISDKILKKVVTFSLQETGEPPTRFAFLVLGSEGRKEQTLKTDQDNAIIYENISSNSGKEVNDYFLLLGATICHHLNTIGFELCAYEIMAKNPKWCQPIHQWKQYFWEWIHTAEPEALLHSCIFFDFRLGYGEESLVRELKESLFSSLSKWAGFFRHMAENALLYKPPLDFFGSFVLQHKEEGERKGKFLDVKSPMRLIVDFARIYSLKNKIDRTNTLERLWDICSQGSLEKEDYEEIVHAYSQLMQTRLFHQAQLMTEENYPPDNFVDPKRLTHIEQQSLKESFKRIRMAQGKMRMELVHDVGIA